MGIVLEEGKEAHGGGLDGGLGQGRIGGGMEDAAVAEDGEPGKDEAQRDEHHAEDELAQGAAARDAGDEQPHERCPGHPPGPEEDGPGGFPGGALRAFVGIGLEGLDRQRLEVVADVLHHGVEQELGGTGEEQGDDQQDGGQHVELGQPAHALVDAGHGRGGRCDGDDDDDDGLGELRGLDAEDVGQAGVGLQHADAQAGGQAQQRADHAEDVDAVAEPAVGPLLAEHGHERRAQRQRQVVAVGEVGQCHADERVDAPAVQAPVQEGLRQGGPSGQGCAALAGDRCEVVGQRFGDTEEEQVDANARGEQHGGPGQVREVGLLVVLTQLDVAVLGHAHVQREDAVGGDDQHVVPAEAVGHPGQGVAEHLFAEARKGQGEADQREGEQRRDREDDAVDGGGRVGRAVDDGRRGRAAGVLTGRMLRR